MFNKLERQKKVLMAPLLHHQQRRLQQQEIQHKELDKIKSRRGKAKAALSFYCITYCNGLLECPTTFSSFVIRQHEHFFSKHILASWCLQTGHTQACFDEIFLRCVLKYLASMYSQSVTRGNPMPRRIASVRMLTRRRSSEIANSPVAIASIKSQR